MWRSLLRKNETLVALTIIVLSIIIGIINPVFFTVGNVFDLLRSATVMGIFAMGVLIVIISGGIDVSFTAIAIFAMYSTVRVLNAYMPEAPLWIAFVISALIGLGLGMINAFFISRFKLPTLIVTLATLSMYRGLLLFAIGNKIIRDIPPSMTRILACHPCGGADGVRRCVQAAPCHLPDCGAAILSLYYCATPC